MGTADLHFRPFNGNASGLLATGPDGHMLGHLEPDDICRCECTMCLSIADICVCHLCREGWFRLKPYIGVVHFTKLVLDKHPASR